MREIEILRVARAGIEAFLDEMFGCETIVSTSLHGLIIANAYGIPARLASFVDSDRQIHGDGMKFDDKGNLYSVGPGGVWVFSPQGKHLGLIVPPEFAPGFTFGDRDGKTLYLAASSKLARIRLNVAGAR